MTARYRDAIKEIDKKLGQLEQKKKHIQEKAVEPFIAAAIKSGLIDLDISTEQLEEMCRQWVARFQKHADPVEPLEEVQSGNFVFEEKEKPYVD